MILHENRLPADDSHEKSCLIGYFLKKRQILKLASAANYRWRFKVENMVQTCKCSRMSFLSYVIPLGVITGSLISSKLILPHKQSGTSLFWNKKL